jgi:hypothetical protein
MAKTKIVGGVARKSTGHSSQASSRYSSASRVATRVKSSASGSKVAKNK